MVAYFHLCGGGTEHNPVPETETKSNINKMNMTGLLSAFASQFVSFILPGAMVIMNRSIGVIMNSMEESQRDHLSRINAHLYYHGI